MSKAGINNPFYGKTHTAEVRKRISLARKGKIPWNKGVSQWESKPHPMMGKKQSPEARLKISIALKGKLVKEKNPAWKGGTQTQDHMDRVVFRKKLQKAIFKRDDYTCQLCGTRGVDLQVDHIQSWAEYVEQRFNMNNCRTLCAKCHYQITFGREMPKDIKGWGHNLLKGGH